jgi:DNA-binding NarL/FixJ family response regulator
VLFVTRIGDGYDSTLDVSQVPERLEGTTTDRQVSVLLVEDDAIVRAWVRLALERSRLRLVGEAASMGEGLELARRRRPELMLVDYRLPDGSGTELVRRLRDEGIEVPAVLMTAGPERGLNESAREAGAQGTVLKTDRGEELLATLLAVLDGEEPFDPQHPRRSPGRAPLTPRERDVLRLVAAGATNAEIAEQLGVGEETVKTLLSRVFLKLGVRRRAEAVSVAQRAGLL